MDKGEDEGKLAQNPMSHHESFALRYNVSPKKMKRQWERSTGVPQVQRQGGGVGRLGSKEVGKSGSREVQRSGRPSPIRGRNMSARAGRARRRRRSWVMSACVFTCLGICFLGHRGAGLPPLCFS